MASGKMEVLIKLKDEEPFTAELIPNSARTDVDNWLTGKRPLTIFVSKPGNFSSTAERDIKSKLGVELGKTAQIIYVGGEK